MKNEDPKASDHSVTFWSCLFYPRVTIFFWAYILKEISPINTKASMMKEIPIKNSPALKSPQIQGGFC